MSKNPAQNVRPRWKKFLRALAVIFLITIPIIIVGAAALLFVYEFGLGPFRCLPSDETLIRHFQKHRADFELLVQIYREDPDLPNNFGMVSKPTPEISAIMNRINVRDLRSDWTIWLPPDPYSEEAKSETKARKLIQKVHRGEAEGRRFSGVSMTYDHGPVRRFDKYLSEVFKGYYYTPFPPRVENGLLKKPDGAEPVFHHLNTYPPRLILGDCVYRQFAPQWFIKLCQ
ncbi:hypothetical protein [Desulfomonile tiedjei]|uniref:Uncharacterized protein n=1 Tax=Desulfomonile tiedjei (strain ATCC 49306 / DSM 6799 / DCB-1) TaxID=706587 RepID=I4CAQ1_DESTA|nr:hypothetical protein [Desulfomonile tiedjei]AFM26642.1 hypothetical protein Desti_4001 [Desulfomonile tiedjei DSM 6799]